MKNDDVEYTIEGVIIKAYCLDCIFRLDCDNLKDCPLHNNLLERA